VKIAVSAAFGLEKVVSKELAALGLEKCGGEDGMVLVDGDERALAAANIMLRSADRVSLLLKEFEASAFESVYEAVRSVPWENYLKKESKIIVQAKSVKSRLSSEPALQSVAKKAVVDSLLNRYHGSVLPETGFPARILIRILKDRARLFINASGEALHKRNYALKRSRAPLRETLAAALVLLSRWKGREIIADPFCGGGTIPIEAALIMNHIYPARKRRFDAEYWPSSLREPWEEVRQSACEEERDSGCFVLGSDIDPEMVALSEECARRAGVEKMVRFERGDARSLKLPGKKGLLITNPPYGERLLDGAETAGLMKALGEAMAQYPGWDISLLTGMEAFEKAFGRKAHRNRKLYNGALRTYLYQYYGEPHG
jgi:putative N6-adenine-specific DNA methylase